MTRRRWSCAIVLAGVLVVAGCASAPPPDSTAAHHSALVARVSGPDARRHLTALQHIADANGGNRAAPGPGYAASVDYVAGVLRAAGYDVTTPTYPVSDDGPRLREVVAQTRTGDPDRVVMLGAHLDSVPDGPGINDNGSGVAALLEIATKLGASPALRSAVRFGFWGSEEDDMQGSTSYVDSLSRTDREHLQLYLNVDMLASPNAGYFVQSGGEGADTVATVLTQQLTATGAPPETIDLDDGSDFAPFVDADVPTGSLLAGDQQRKSREQATRWGGRAGVDFDPCYHSACDRVTNIDPVALNRYTDAVAGTLVYFATSPDVLTR